MDRLKSVGLKEWNCLQLKNFETKYENVEILTDSICQCLVLSSELVLKLQARCSYHEYKTSLGRFQLNSSEVIHEALKNWQMIKKNSKPIDNSVCVWHCKTILGWKFLRGRMDHLACLEMSIQK